MEVEKSNTGNNSGTQSVPHTVRTRTRIQNVQARVLPVEFREHSDSSLLMVLIWFGPIALGSNFVPGTD